MPMTRDDPPRIDGLRCGAQLGTGGFATVWSAVRGDEQVAIKVAHGSTDLIVARFAREAEGLRAVGAPHVPRLIDTGRLADGRPFIVMERLDGETLAAWLARRERAPSGAELAPFVDRMLVALAAVHASGHVHRDLKPENVMLVSGDRVALLDLGLAAEVQRDDGLTRTGTVLGTPEYMAPERLLGETVPETEPAADIYAVGVIVFELLTRRLPFTGDAAQIELGHLTKRPPRVRDLVPASSALDDVLQACLAKDPAQRPTLAELRTRLHDALLQPAELSVASAQPAREAEAGSRREPVVLVCVDTGIGISRVTEIVERERGFVAKQRGDRYVAVFAGSASDDPAARAVAAARYLTQGSDGRAALHVATVVLRKRRDAWHALGAAVERPETWLPAGSEPIVFTDAIAALLPKTAVPATPSQANVDQEVPFVGAEAERARIDSVVRRALAAREPALVTIIGEQGLGKSRLLREVAASIDGARKLSIAGGDATARLAHLLGDPDGDHEEHLGERLVRAAEREPVLLLVDNAQLADHVVLEAIEYATLSTDRACALAIVVAATPRFEQGRQRWGSRAHKHEHVVLAPLSDEAASTLAASLLAPAEYPSADALARLAAWSGHNPARLVDLIRTIKQQGFVRQRDGGGAWYLATTELDKLPRTAPDQWIASRELDALPAELASVARTCAVVGSPITADELSKLIAVLERDGHPVTQLDPGVALRELARHGLFVATRGAWAFRSKGVMAGVYELLPGSQRTAIHRAALAITDANDLERLARHAAGAGERARAAHAYLSIGDSAQRAGEQVRADEAYSAALDATDEPLLRERALAGRGRSRWRIYRMREAIEDLDAARELAAARGADDATLDYLLEQAMALDWEREMTEAIARVELAAPLAARTVDERLSARYELAFGRSRWREEAIPEAIARLSSAARRATAVGDDETRIAALLLLACAQAQSGDVAGADTSFADVIDLTTRLGDRLHLCAAYGNRLFLWIARREPERAFDDLRHAIRLARELGNPNPELTATHNLAELLLWAGDDEAALAPARRAAELAERFSDGALPICQLLVARIHVMRGENEPARAILARLATENELPTSTRVFGATLRIVLDGVGDWETVLAEARAGLYGEELIEILYWRCRELSRAARHADARACFAEIDGMLEQWPIWRNRADQLRRMLAAVG